MDAAIWGLLGAIVGALASISATWLSILSSYRLQREKDQSERIERARSFQRETLVDLQEAIHDALRTINRAHMEDLNAHRAGKPWGTNLLPEELDEGVRLTLRRVLILVERVADDEVRQQVKGLMGNLWATLLANSLSESQNHFRKVFKDSTPVLERIGTVLRQNY